MADREGIVQWPAQALDSSQPIPPGTRVEVHSAFRPSWATGFEVAALGAGMGRRYWLRRLSDGAVLPVEFIENDVRRAGDR
jgi:hypothetical protein